MNKIVFADKEFICELRTERYLLRDCYKFVLTAPYADIVKYFIDNAVYSWQYDTTYTDEQGIEQTSTVVKDLSAYGKALDIIDKRDGTFYVYMGKKTDAELIAEKDEQIATLTAMVAKKEAVISNLTKEAVATK